MIQAIDVHAHFGEYVGYKFPIEQELLSADVHEVVRRARMANTRLTLVSPLAALFPGAGYDPLRANTEASRIVAEADGLLHWIVIDPTRPKSYDQAAEMLKLPKAVGIKIHPEQHGYFISEHGKAIFEFAARHNAIIESHSGEERSLPGDFQELADDFPEVRLIISHLGYGFDNDLTRQVRAIGESKHGNIFTDTSSAKSITPNLIEWAVERIGAEHILYGTDSPLYFAPMQRARIDNAGISEEDKRLILHDNAARLFKLEDSRK